MNLDDNVAVREKVADNRNSDVLAAGLPAFEQTRLIFPDPEIVGVRPGLRMEVLHVPGPPPPLVFIHGGLGSLWNPYPQLAAFRDRHELLTYALAGNGRSDRLAISSLQSHVDDLAALLAQRRVTAPVVIGWDYGAAIALEYAKLNPVMGVVITGGAAYDMTRFRERLRMRWMMTFKSYRRLSGDRVMRRLAKRMCHPETSNTVVDEILKANPMPKRDSAWQTVSSAFWGYDGRETLDEIQAPSLVVYGEADRLIPREAAKTTADLLTDGVFFELAGAGHAAPLERPRAFNELIAALIEGANEPETWPATIEALRPTLEAPKLP